MIWEFCLLAQDGLGICPSSGDFEGVGWWGGNCSLAENGWVLSLGAMISHQFLLSWNYIWILSFLVPPVKQFLPSNLICALYVSWPFSLFYSTSAKLTHSVIFSDNEIFGSCHFISEGHLFWWSQLKNVSFSNNFLGRGTFWSGR